MPVVVVMVAVSMILHGIADNGPDACSGGASN